jgi:hypothetical protein
VSELVPKAQLEISQTHEPVPKVQPDISQTQSVWYRGKGKPVLKGRWKHLNDDCLLEIPSSFQDESICASNPDTACLANFRRRSATPNAAWVQDIKIGEISG